MKVSVCIVNKDPNKPLEKTFDSLKDNMDYIDDIVISTKAPKSYGARSLHINSQNEALHRNACLKAAKNPYILWLSSDSELEEDTLEEFLDILEDYPDTDIIYPNEVYIDNGEEEVKNYTDWHGAQNSLLQSLSIEKHLPKWGVLTKKESLVKAGGFEELYGPQTFYGYIYKNLKNISLKLSDLSFVNNYENENFIDTSYHSKLLRDVFGLYPIKELFGSLEWENEPVATATALTLTADRLFEYFDFFNASNFYRQALLTFHNQESLRKLIETYIRMGLFDEAKKMAHTQSMEKIEEKEIIDRIETTQKLVEKIESSVKEGRLSEILGAAQEIFDYYNGAPLYNIFGVIEYLLKNYPQAYRYFYKAVTMNPVDNDIISNLADMAKRLDKEEEVLSLINRITR